MQFGASFSFRADGLSLLFAMLISGIGTLVVIYAGGYLGKEPQPRALLRLALRLHGRHARRGALRQPAPALRLLGTDQSEFLHAHRLRA